VCVRRVFVCERERVSGRKRVRETERGGWGWHRVRVGGTEREIDCEREHMCV